LYLKLDRAEGAETSWLRKIRTASLVIYTHTALQTKGGRKARIDLKRCYFLNEFSCVV